MEKSTLIGVILAVVSIGVGMVLKGADPMALLNPAALLIIFGGTGAALFIAFSMEDIKKLPTLFKIVFKQQKLQKKMDLINWFADMISITRREGLLSLEAKVDDIEDQFLKGGLRLIIDGNDQEFVRDVLLEDISAMEERHRAGALIFTQAGTYSPTLGVAGAVIGLIAALGNLAEVEKLGHLISAAFVATLFGIVSGYVFYHPIANKLKQMSKKEVELKLMMIEGLLSIQNGVSAIAVRQKLLVFIPNSERDQENSEDGAAKGEAAVE